MSVDSSNSSNITKESVKKVGLLGRLFTQIDDAKLGLYQSQLSAVLGYANELSKIDTGDFSPHQAISVIGINDLRDDQPNNDPESYERVRQNIMRNFPARQGDFLQLPVRIIEEN
jgi:aspartyl/glutamyl-tRNA(Asn/Gln) amidotransferase C subunit